MSKVVVKPCELKGQINIQPSKSYLHRLIIVSGLLKRNVIIKNVNYSDDIMATLSCMKNIGLIDYEKLQEGLRILKGDGKVKGELDCMESGSTLRFLIPVALTMNQPIIFKGKQSLLKRPLSIYEELCKENGYEFQKNGDKILVKGNFLQKEYTLPCDISSQFVTGMIFALVKNGGKSKIILKGKIESRGYIDITLDVLGMFGIKTTFKNNVIDIDANIQNDKETFFCEGDWSHGAFYACYGALKGGITLKGLDINSKQKDASLLKILEQMGAKYKVLQNGDIFFDKAALESCDIDGGQIPDIVPILGMVLSLCKGKSKIFNAGRLKYKECDRLKATMECLNSIGGKVTKNEDTLFFEGVERFTGGKTTVFNDHRMAMTMAVCSCFSEYDIELDNKECVKKSAPNFWNEFASLGGKYV